MSVSWLGGSTVIRNSGQLAASLTQLQPGHGVSLSLTLFLLLLWETLLFLNQEEGGRKALQGSTDIRLHPDLRVGLGCWAWEVNVSSPNTCGDFPFDLTLRSWWGNTSHSESRVPHLYASDSKRLRITAQFDLECSLFPSDRLTLQWQGNMKYSRRCCFLLYVIIEYLPVACRQIWGGFRALETAHDPVSAMTGAQLSFSLLLKHDVSPEVSVELHEQFVLLQ